MGKGMTDLNKMIIILILLFIFVLLVTILFQNTFKCVKYETKCYKLTCAKGCWRTYLDCNDLQADKIEHRCVQYQERK